MLHHDLTNKVAMVTGARGGIGKGIALAFANAGADVAVCDRVIDDGKLEGVAGEIKALGRRSLSVAVDVRIPEQVDNFVKQTVDSLDRIDILVNNAGATFRCPVEEMSPNGWDAIINTNLKGPFLFCRAAGKIMIKQKKGKIINIASVSGMNASPGSAHYGASKAGLINFTQSLAAEWGRYHINVNAIAPGPVDTEGVRAATGMSREKHEERVKDIPLGRLGQPEDIAHMALFLGSEASDFVTGAIIVVSGGSNLVMGRH